MTDELDTTSSPLRMGALTNATSSNMLQSYRRAILDSCRLPKWVHASMPKSLQHKPANLLFQHEPLLKAPEFTPAEIRHRANVDRRRARRDEERKEEEEERRSRVNEAGKKDMHTTSNALRRALRPAPVAPVILEPVTLPLSSASSTSQARTNPASTDNSKQQQLDDSLTLPIRYHGLDDVRFRNLKSPQQPANVFPYTHASNDTSDAQRSFWAAAEERKRSLIIKEFIDVYQKKPDSDQQVIHYDGSVVIERNEEELGNGNRQAESIRAGIRSFPKKKTDPLTAPAPDPIDIPLLKLAELTARVIGNPNQATNSSTTSQSARLAPQSTLSLPPPPRTARSLGEDRLKEPFQTKRKTAAAAAAATSSSSMTKMITASRFRKTAPAPTTTNHVLIGDESEQVLETIAANNGRYVLPPPMVDEEGKEIIHLPATMEPQIMKLKGIQPGTSERQIRWCFEGVQVEVRRVRMQSGSEGAALVEYWPLGVPPRKVKRTVYERLYRIQGESKLLADLKKRTAGEAPRFFGLDFSTSYTDRRAKLLQKVAIDMNVQEKYYTMMSFTPMLNSIHHRIDKQQLLAKEKIEAEVAVAADQNAALDAFTGINISRDLAALFAKEAELESTPPPVIEPVLNLADPVVAPPVTFAEVEKENKLAVARESRRRISRLMNPAPIPSPTAAALSEAPILEESGNSNNNPNNLSRTSTLSLPTTDSSATPSPLPSPPNAKAAAAATAVTAAGGAGASGSNNAAPAAGGSASKFNFQVPKEGSLNFSGVLSPSRASVYWKAKKHSADAEAKQKNEMKKQAVDEREEMERQREIEEKLAAEEEANRRVVLEEEGDQFSEEDEEYEEGEEADLHLKGFIRTQPRTGVNSSSASSDVGDEMMDALSDGYRTAATSHSTSAVMSPSSLSASPSATNSTMHSTNASMTESELLQVAISVRSASGDTTPLLLSRSSSTTSMTPGGGGGGSAGPGSPHRGGRLHHHHHHRKKSPRFRIPQVLTFTPSAEVQQAAVQPMTTPPQSTSGLQSNENSDQSSNPTPIMSPSSSTKKLLSPTYSTRVLHPNAQKALALQSTMDLLHAQASPPSSGVPALGNASLLSPSNANHFAISGFNWPVKRK